MSRSAPVLLLLVLAFAAILFVTRLGERALWSEEVRWAAIPREMQTSGNYLWPTINGQTYYDKPLGSYWLVLAASWLTGGVGELSARLPSACSGLLGVLLLMLIARRLYDDRTAALAGLILATSYSFTFFARTASTDAETVTGVLAALWLYLRNEGRPGWWVLGLWLIMALTSLTKGLLGFALPVLILVTYATLAGPLTLTGIIERNRWLLDPRTLLAVLLGVGVYLLPFVLSYLTTGSTAGLDMVFRENVRRFYDPVNHRGPIYLYVPVLFLLLAPWSLLLPAALAQAHHNRRGDLFALAYFWSVFVFYTLASSRRSYYLLPILPAAALLIGRLLTQEELCRSARYLRYAGLGLLAVGFALSAAVLVPPTWRPGEWSTFPSLPSPMAFLIAWALVVLVFVLWRRTTLTLSVGSGAMMAYLFLFFFPTTDGLRTQRPFAEGVKDHVGAAHGRLALYRTREISYYLNQPGPIAEYHSPNALAQGAQADEVRWVVMRRRELKGLGVPARVVLAETNHPWEGGRQAEAKLVLVEVTP